MDEKTMKTKFNKQPAQRMQITHRTQRAQLGFTLMELLAVIVIIGVLMATIGSRFMGQSEKAKANAAKIEMGQMLQSPAVWPTGVARTCARTILRIRGATTTNTRRPARTTHHLRSSRLGPMAKTVAKARTPTSPRADTLTRSRRT